MPKNRRVQPFHDRPPSHTGKLGANQVTIERVAEVGRKYAACVDAHPKEVGVEDSAADVRRCRRSPPDCAHRRDKHIIAHNVVVGKLLELPRGDEATETLDEVVGQHILYADCLGKSSRVLLRSPFSSIAYW